MDNSKKLSEILRQSGSPHIPQAENSKQSSFIAPFLSPVSPSPHGWNSYKNLDQTLADLRGHIAKALHLDEKDDETFEQRKEIAENELHFLFDLFGQIPDLRRKLNAAQDQLNKLDSTYNEMKK